MAKKKKAPNSLPNRQPLNASAKKKKKRKNNLPNNKNTPAKTTSVTQSKNKTQSPKKKDVVAKLVITKDKETKPQENGLRKQIPLTNPEKVTEVYIESEDENETIELHIEENLDKLNEEDMEFCFKLKKKKVWWTKEETNALLEGVEKHGRGKWKEILMDNYPLFNRRRSTRDLSDKMRTLDRRSSIFVCPNVVYTRVDEHNKPVLDWEGNPRTYFCQFPHEAALLAANDGFFIPNRIIRISCGEGDEKAFHIYKAFRKGGGRIRVRKMSGRSRKRNDGW